MATVEDACAPAVVAAPEVVALLEVETVEGDLPVETASSVDVVVVPKPWSLSRTSLMSTRRCPSADASAEARRSIAQSRPCGQRSAIDVVCSVHVEAVVVEREPAIDIADPCEAPEVVGEAMPGDMNVGDDAPALPSDATDANV